MGSAIGELDDTGSQSPQATIQLASWAKSVRRGASVRLDMWPLFSCGAAYFLASHPLCSQLPLWNRLPARDLLPQGRYIVATLAVGRPAHAIWPALSQNAGYSLHERSYFPTSRGEHPLADAA